MIPKLKSQQRINSLIRMKKNILTMTAQNETPRRNHPFSIAASAALAVAILVSQNGCSRQEADSEQSSDGSVTAQTATVSGLLDDYSDPVQNSYGVERLLIDDSSTGSRSRADQETGNGVLSVDGELLPGRGVPAFISMVSSLASDGSPQDLTGYEGVRLVVKVTAGTLCVQVASSDIDNYDYHTSAPLSGSQDGFREVRLPFTDLKRAWSEQTRLDLKSITSVNLVSFGLAREAFAYQVDEIGFY
jgi:hypothetical protein